MARATIPHVAKAAKLSVSTVNRALHEPHKLREETLKQVLQAAESVGFYGTATLKQGLRLGRPKVRVGILLLQRHRTLYRDLAKAIEAAALASRDHEVMTRIEFLDELSAQNVAAGIHKLAEQCDVIGVVSTEHPIVSAAIEELSARGIKVFAIISQLTARCNVGYVGLDAWKVGRVAGWAIDNICKRPGKIGILVGNHRYRCQETNESGFRSYFREHANGFELLEAQSTFETASIAQEVTEDILAKHPDLLGLLISGGGVSGALNALRSSGRSKDIVAVGYDLTEVTRAGLLDGTLNFLVSHPLPQLASEMVSAMIRTFDNGAEYPPQSISLPFEIYTPENIY
ncbi:LacI family DNA-binding transcriptional regulator [Aestuariivirga litoralis]|uniref:LacI family DNA-binding transcriptional regulator n=1 Tax=Aestuariivirga litoralis TaxID=2650924 RepID=UPI0018C786C3|nr:LacI family DNA-binding transcriptional regulator [Aestuariivirga litoralis]MBG1231070.1 LacI family DNA-binding transcriptional regulator [Aestuariivirga litoralis]